MKKYVVLTTLALSLCLVSAKADNILTYRLLSDSSITESGNADSSHALAGYFTWTPVFPSQVVDSAEFFTTSLDFTSDLYSMTLAINGRNWMNSTKIGPNGSTLFHADIDLLNSDQNPWWISGFGSGTYEGSPWAPMEITFDSETITPGAGGYSIARLYIHAELVPTNVPEAGATIGLVGFAMAGLFALRRKFCQN